MKVENMNDEEYSYPQDLQKPGERVVPSLCLLGPFSYFPFHFILEGMEWVIPTTTEILILGVRILRIAIDFSSIRKHFDEFGFFI
jgi:hypothetical protein